MEFLWKHLNLLLNILGRVIKKRISVENIFVSAAVLNMFVQFLWLREFSWLIAGCMQGILNTKLNI